MKRLFIFVSLVLIISLLLNLKLLHDRFSPRKVTFKVVEVIDGDTFKINDHNETRRVRLMGVNTPETGKCLSSEAKDKLIQLVLGKEVTLDDQFSDPYGRIMANVFMGNEYINKEMLLSGFGRMDYYENPHRDELKVAYSEARTKKLGLFSGKCISYIPPQKNCNIKGNVDENTQKKLYFLPDCNNYSQVTIDLSTNDQWFCSELEASKAGFIKSQTCQI